MTDIIGRTLGQYRIVEQIGQGGMATVYRAYQPALDRYVAVKVLPPTHAKQPGFSERFRREAKAIANLNHPNILPVYDSGREGAYSFIVMRYVEGAHTLKEVMEAPLDPSQITGLIGQVAAALDHAHQQGVIHRDVKPGNVLMDGDWALLTDFGLAKMAEASVKLTGTGVGVGTPAYMSPEQGQGLPVDHRTDIYALGIILFEMLTGQIPHAAETPLATVLKRVTEPLPLPRAINPEIPETVERVLLKALAYTPADRFETAGEMAEALNKAGETHSPPFGGPGGHLSTTRLGKTYSPPFGGPRGHLSATRLGKTSPAKPAEGPKMLSPGPEMELPAPETMLASCLHTARQAVRLYPDYNPDLYTPRRQEALFEKFLHSDKACLPLIGDSGMGKSVLLYHLAMTYLERGYGPILQAGKLESDLATLDRAIVKFLDPTLHPPTTNTLLLPDYLNQIGDSLETPFIVFVDGLNENADPKTLLTTIHQLILQCEGLALRFVLSCRTETWRNIWATLRLDHNLPVSLYYGLETARELMTGLSDTIRLGLYTDQELEQTYKRLQLQPAWVQVQKAQRIKEWLRDPLLLWLVAEVYVVAEAGEIPLDAPSHHVMAKYFAYVKAKTDVPDEADKTLCQIVDLMRQPRARFSGTCARFLGKRRHIIPEDKLRAIGLSLEPGSVVGKLIDMGILERLLWQSSGDVPIPALRFTKDRFLEFLLYRLLSSTLPSGELTMEATLELIEESSEFTFIWGALQYWLGEQWPVPLLMELARHPSIYVRNFLASLCERQSHEFEDRVHHLLQASLETETVESKQFAVMAAYASQNLKILEQALVDNSVQLLVTEYLEYLYDSDPDAALDLLERLSQKVKKGVLGAIWGFDYISALIYLTVLLGPKYIADKGEVDRIIQFWVTLLRQIVPKVIYMPVGKKVSQKLARDLVVDLISRAAMRALSSNEGGFLDGVAFKEFYDMPLEQRQRVSLLAPYTGGAVLDETGADLIFELAQIDNGVFFTAVRATIASQGYLHWEETEALAFRMFNECNAMGRGCAASGLGLCLLTPEWATHEKLVFYLNFVINYTNTPPYGRLKFNGREKPGWIVYYIGLANYRLNQLDQDLAANNILLDYLQETLWSATNPAYFDEAADHLAMLAVDTELFFVFELLKGLYGQICHAPQDRADVYRVVVRALSQLYMKYPVEVYSFVVALGEMGAKSPNQLMMDLQKEEHSLYAANLMSNRFSYFMSALTHIYPDMRRDLLASIVERYPSIENYPAGVRQLVNDVLHLAESVLP